MDTVPISQLALHASGGPNPPLKLLRFASVRSRTGLSRSTIWRLERNGGFPGTGGFRPMPSPGSRRK